MGDHGTLIVGAGLAGLRCATSLRSLGYAAPIHLVGDEPYLPYERPPLSKGVLAHTREPDTLAMTSTGQLTDFDIDLQVGVRVNSLDLDGGARLSDGTLLRWVRLVFATGARARTLPGSGHRADVLTLRSLDDALALRQKLSVARRIAIIGCGFVGAEVASTARDAGVEVTMIEAATVPFERSLGRAAGAILAQRYRAAGVDLRLDAGSVRLAECGRGVVTERGAVVDADVILVGIGAVPNDELFHLTFGGSAGRGIAVDAAGATSIEGVYACGDVAAGRSGRREHWTSAAAGADAVARDIVGKAQLPALPHYAWSDQFGLRIQVVGTTGGAASVEIADSAPDSLKVHYLDRSGRLIGGVASNRPGDVAGWRRQIAG